MFGRLPWRRWRATLYGLQLSRLFGRRRRRHRFGEWRGARSGWLHRRPRSPGSISRPADGNRGARRSYPKVGLLALHAATIGGSIDGSGSLLALAGCSPPPIIGRIQSSSSPRPDLKRP